MEYDVISNYYVSAALQKEQHHISASRRVFASLVKGGGLPQASRRDFLKKIDFKKKVLRCLIPQSSAMTAPDGSPSPLSLRDISPHCGESPFTREPFDISPHRVESPFSREPNKGSKLYLSIACATAGFQHTVQIFTNTVEVAVYLIIGNSYNRKSVLFKKFCPFGVIFNSFILVVL